jgi:hypothetical protein
MLGMFDAPTQIGFFRVLLKSPLKDVEGFPVGTVADGVNAKLEPMSYGQLCGFG